MDNIRIFDIRFAFSALKYSEPGKRPSVYTLCHPGRHRYRNSGHAEITAPFVITVSAGRSNNQVCLNRNQAPTIMALKRCVI